MQNNLLSLCHSSELSEGCARGFDVFSNGSDDIFLVKYEGKIHAWRNACPHINGAPMAWRKDAYMNAAGTHISCHAHGALFLPDTGLCIRGPCTGEYLTEVEIGIDGRGFVYIQETEYFKE
jgi:nitrite reductase/ring-hydroxylating ferredoxin subunit